MEDIFNESDESSSDADAAGAADDDLDDEENPPEDRLITLENEDSTQDRCVFPIYWKVFLINTRVSYSLAQFNFQVLAS